MKKRSGFNYRHKLNQTGACGTRHDARKRYNARRSLYMPRGVGLTVETARRHITDPELKHDQGRTVLASAADGSGAGKVEAEPRNSKLASSQFSARVVAGLNSPGCQYPIRLRRVGLPSAIRFNRLKTQLQPE